MLISGDKYSGLCQCGRTHKIDTMLAVIENGCLADFDRFMENLGLHGKRAAVYDENTYAAKGLKRPSARQEIILPPDNLHADERATAIVLDQLDADAELIIAIGGGSIHDIVRYSATDRGIPFVSCPTAAGMDGFCSTVSAMTWHGFKKTIPGIAPTIVLADLDVICQAPLNLALSGVGDIFGKYTALLDWNIAHILTDEYICPEIEMMTRKAVDAVYDCCRQVAARDPEALGRLTYCLLLSGLAMQMMGNSRPASGSEHHISHFIEMEPETLPVRNTALHGEKVGVGAALVVEEYHKLAQINDIRPFLREYRPVSEFYLKKAFGSRLLASVMEENRRDCLSGVRPDKLAEQWPLIRKMILDLPTRKELEGIYKEIGAKHSLEDLDIDAGLLPQLLDHSPYVRNRLTLMRARHMIDTAVHRHTQ